jgi:hypothetical protein
MAEAGFGDSYVKPLVGPTPWWWASSRPWSEQPGIAEVEILHVGHELLEVGHVRGELGRWLLLLAFARLGLTPRW